MIDAVSKYIGYPGMESMSKELNRTKRFFTVVLVVWLSLLAALVFGLVKGCSLLLKAGKHVDEVGLKNAAHRVWEGSTNEPADWDQVEPKRTE